MRRSYLIAVLAVVLAGTTAGAQVSYFPPVALSDVAKASELKKEWYSKCLQVLKEPSLWEFSKTQAIQSYRFLWIRSFNRPISVRLDVNKDGTGLVTTKIASGQAWCDPGHLTDKRLKLTGEETDWFLDRIDELTFWNLPVLEPKEIGPDGKEIRTVNLDGAEWVFEGVKDGRYHLTDRWSPKNGAGRSLGLMMLFDFARLKLPDKEVY